MSKITVPIGPQHPLLKEPVAFSLTMEGEHVIESAMRLGYVHRGIERLGLHLGLRLDDRFGLGLYLGCCLHHLWHRFGRVAQFIHDLAQLLHERRRLRCLRASGAHPRAGQFLVRLLLLGSLRFCALLLGRRISLRLRREQLITQSATTSTS